MKTIFRTFGIVALLAVFLAVGGLSAFGQEACDTAAIEAKYAEVTGGYKSQDLATFKKAVEAAKAFLEKYGECPPAAESAAWLKKKLPDWEKTLTDWVGADAKAKALGKFDEAVKNKNWDAAYAAGNEFAAKYPDSPEFVSYVAYPLGVMGLYQAYEPTKNYKYNADTLKYAKMTIDLLKSGKQSAKKVNNTVTPDTFGIYSFECKRDDCISELTLAQAYINYFASGNKPEGISKYYEVTKIPGRQKNNPIVYGIIGDYYFDSVKKLVEDLKAKVADQKDTDTDEVRQKKEADYNQTKGMLNGYAERAMDAYSRAYTLAKADPKAKVYADKIYTTLQQLYTVRFQKQEGIDTWIAERVKQPLPDPASAVAPVIDAETSTGNTNAPAAAPTATPSAPAKPAANGPVKPGTTTKVGASSSTTTPTTAKAGSAVAKKKGTK
jgi:hypothetical protein